MKKRASAIDFTTGSTLKSLLLYFLPVLAGGLFQQLYATVDAVILGQFAMAGGLVLSAVCVTTAPLGLRLMSVPNNVYPLALRYVQIYFAGLADRKSTRLNSSHIA